ncbi:MAG: hypothetical protein U0457_13770 [Candidatus Sericytochromatia bacterium]
MNKSLFLSFCFILTSLPSYAEQQIAIFKNNLSFNAKTVNIENKNNAIITDPPNAILGALWFQSDKKIKSLTSESINLDEKVKVENLKDLLDANIGKDLKVTLNTNEKFKVVIEKIQGSLIFCKNFFDGKNEPKNMVLELNNIKFVEFDDKYQTEFKKKVNKRIIKAEFEGDANNLEMFYMQRGLGWLPSYNLELLDQEKAKLTLNSIIVNNAEDFENANISLVIGYPNFIYESYNSPLTSDQEFGDFIRQFDFKPKYNNYNAPVQSLSNIAYQSAGSYNNDYSLPSNIEGDLGSQEDLYFYKIPKKISLKKSSRMMTELFSNEVKYESIYETELESNSDKNYYYYQKKGGDNNSINNNINTVTHYLKFKNTSKYPLTTGIVMVTKNESNNLNPISQEKINYTPMGATAKVKLTLSPDIYVNETEKETSRKENIKMLDGTYYDLINIESKIYIRNSKNKDIKLSINKVIEGELEKSSYKWDFYNLNKYKVQNKTNKVEWNLDLKSSETREIKYNYSLYVRR